MNFICNPPVFVTLLILGIIAVTIYAIRYRTPEEREWARLDKEEEENRIKQEAFDRQKGYHNSAWSSFQDFTREDASIRNITRTNSSVISSGAEIEGIPETPLSREPDISSYAPPLGSPTQTEAPSSDPASSCSGAASSSQREGASSPNRRGGPFADCFDNC